MPWMVTSFGILVIPLGLVHIFPVISQPVLVGAWCTLCLLAAAIMLPMIPLQVDEVIAMGQHMVQAKRWGESLWEVVWKGGSPEGSEEDQRTPEIVDLSERPREVVASSLWGMRLPWILAISTALGIWLMVAPEIFGMTGIPCDLHRLGGALIVVTSVIAIREPLCALPERVAGARDHRRAMAQRGRSACCPHQQRGRGAPRGRSRGPARSET